MHCDVQQQTEEEEASTRCLRGRLEIRSAHTLTSFIIMIIIKAG